MTADKSITYIKQKKSGWLWVGIGILVLIIALPLMIYGVIKASFNGVVWVSKHPDRRNEKLKRREEKDITKENIIALKARKRDRKEARKNAKEQNYELIEVDAVEEELGE